MSIAEAWVKTAPRHCQDLTGTGNEEKKGNRNNSRSNTGNWSRRRGQIEERVLLYEKTQARGKVQTMSGNPVKKTDVTDGPAN
jgi:hypothetical protein